MLLDRAWPAVCAVVGRSELGDDERFDTYRKRMFENAGTLMAILEEAFEAAPAAEWVRRLNAIGMLAAPVQDHAEVAEDPQVVANRYVQQVDRPGGDPVRMVNIGITIDNDPVPIPRLAPQLGEHTEQILLEAGYTWEEITALRTAGAIAARASG